MPPLAMQPERLRDSSRWLKTTGMRLIELIRTQNGCEKRALWHHLRGANQSTTHYRRSPRGAPTSGYFRGNPPGCKRPKFDLSPLYSDPNEHPGADI